MKKTLLASLITVTSMAALAAETIIVTDENYSLAMHDQVMGV